MNHKEELLNYKKISQLEPKEEKVRETIRKSKELFYAVEQEKILSYHEFLWVQFKVVQKKWWFFQFLLLCLLGTMLLSAYEEYYIHRSMGILASVFVILIIPEFWKNRSCQCMEIEEASYYSLRQIYAARMVLFGIVDVLLLTAFCGTMTMGLHVEFKKLLLQFLLPMLVTACICFGTLCSRHILNETMAVFLCILWCVIWLGISSNEKIYTVVTMPIWLACIGLSLILLCITVYRILNNCNKYWEVSLDAIEI